MFSLQTQQADGSWKTLSENQDQEVIYKTYEQLMETGDYQIQEVRVIEIQDLNKQHTTS